MVTSDKTSVGPQISDDWCSDHSGCQPEGPSCWAFDGSSFPLHHTRKVKTLVPVFRDAQGGQGTSGCQSLDETWSLPRAKLALDTAYTCVQWVVSLRQSLGLRGAYFASSKLLQKNKLERQDDLHSHPRLWGFIWDVGKGQGLLSWAQEEMKIG